MSATARKIAQLESQVRGSIAILWVLANRAGGEIYLTKEDLENLPRGAQLQQKKTSVGVKLIALNPWIGEKLLGRENDMPVEDVDTIPDATGDDQNNM